MSALPDPAVLAVDGDYDLDTLAPGKEYLLTLKGTWNGATITLTFWNDAKAAYTSVDGGAWTADAEERLLAPSRKARLTVTNDGASTSVGVTLIPIVS